jgi:hypothetical protein
MTTRDVLLAASDCLLGLRWHTIDVLSVTRPGTVAEAVNLSLIVSKLSPIIGNLLEFKTISLLNDVAEFRGRGLWKRQDPDFPDALFVGDVFPRPGFEIKAWFPLATEITARFKDSQLRFADDNTWVAMPAWVPSLLICGEPTILDVCIVSGASVAKARDDHYHDPPHYLVLEPEDTTKRTRNLQQTNTAGYVWQDIPERLDEAHRIVEGWGPAGRAYTPSAECQDRLRELTSRFRYRLDTNFAKMDRIVHPEIEAFKSRVIGLDFCGRTIREWSRLIAHSENGELAAALAELLELDTFE